MIEEETAGRILIRYQAEQNEEHLYLYFIESSQDVELLEPSSLYDCIRHTNLNLLVISDLMIMNI